jgi:carboxyl-terminal processing protease
VIDGRGIVPDLELSKKEYSELTKSIVMNDIIFEYVNQYVMKIDSIDSPEVYALDEETYNDFISYVKSLSDFNYSTLAENKLFDLKELIEKDSLYRDLEHELLTIESRLKGDISRDLIRYKSEIVPLIENEIVARFYFQKGKTVHSFSFSESIKASKRIFDSIAEYEKLLNP